jgi:hypothetical protein
VEADTVSIAAVSDEVPFAGTGGFPQGDCLDANRIAALAVDSTME